MERCVSIGLSIRSPKKQITYEWSWLFLPNATATATITCLMVLLPAFFSCFQVQPTCLVIGAHSFETISSIILFSRRVDPTTILRLAINERRSALSYQISFLGTPSW